jgi:hypothetical protein
VDAPPYKISKLLPAHPGFVFKANDTKDYLVVIIMV